MEWTSYKKLSECKAGETVSLLAVTHSSEEFLRFLNSRELRLGLKVTVLSIEPFDGSITVQYDQKAAETLSAIVSEKLLVQ
jgi:DtxR family Mn-dependent transcriptional regulator